MKLNIRYSTVFIFIVVQAIISILFYLDDDFVSGREAIAVFIISLPITYFVEWLRGNKVIEQEKKDEDNQ